MCIRTICIISFPFIALLYNISAQQREDIDAPPNRGYDPLNDPINEDSPDMKITLQAGNVGEAAAMEMKRYTTPTTTRRTAKKTTLMTVSFAENCDYLAHYCLKAYVTGSVCGRALFYSYYTFKNYCLLDYVNCMERYELFQVAFMGVCHKLRIYTEYREYNYEEDKILDQYYILQDT